MRVLCGLAFLLLAGGFMGPAHAQTELTVEEINRMIEELDRAIEQTDEMIGQYDEAIGEADEAIAGIDRTLESVAPYAGMAPIPLIGADGATIDPQVGADFEEAMWCLNGLDVFSQLVALDAGEMAVVDSGMDFFAGLALENAQILGLNDDAVLTMLDEDRANVADELETRLHPVDGTMLEYCMQMATLYYDLYAEGDG